ncbi:HNH endonuclease [Alginatibacterium sediminis]|uniref:HNH endonuclease n=1 Tax=Alginatibacterium sediminis TaxID=2164068 RepID=A0A420EDY2_9ALTE|nr:HNH endonuclease family protein [Alginatibacterium sediminis]RKF18842.1 HNH endonuclease [Alginatibacterium sediminis]
MRLRAATLLTITILLPTTTWADNIIKLSNSGICHDKHSSSYNRTKNFTSFSTLKACLNAGGRLPKGYTPYSNASSALDNEYSRSKFGHGWADLNGDCQDARAEVLIAQSVSTVSFKTEKSCRVVSGRWVSLFTGDTIYSASEIDIDHVIPLKWTWEHGADVWAKDKRKAIANDPANLIAVEASLNRQKGAKGLDEWLPPKNQCQYILRFMRIKKKYDIELSASKREYYNALQTSYCKGDQDQLL